MPAITGNAAMRSRILLTFSVVIPLGYTRAHEMDVQTGSLKGGIAPSADFAALSYRHAGYRVGVFTSPGAQGVLASYRADHDFVVLELGQREKSFDQGFVISNGAYLPWTKNFAFAEPLGARAGIRNRLLALDVMGYQLAGQSQAMGQVSVTPLSWLRFSGGASAAMIEPVLRPVPLASLSLGVAEGKGFGGGAQYAGNRNALIYARYAGSFTLRGFGFYRSDANPLASGIFSSSAGGVAQWISEAWFAQFFSTDTRFGMVRYGGERLMAIAIYEEQTQLAGVSLRNSATGFHLRSGVTFAGDGSVQTLAGLGYSDYLFIGGGHFELRHDQPFEPGIFPAEWYSSVLLQSTSMRIKDRGIKMLALVDTDIVKGFFAITYSESANRQEQFGFFLRVSGAVVF